MIGCCCICINMQHDVLLMIVHADCFVSNAQERGKGEHTDSASLEWWLQVKIIQCSV